GPSKLAVAMCAQQLVVIRSCVSDVCKDCQMDRLGCERPGRRGTANAAAVLAASMFGDPRFFARRTGRELLANGMGKGSDVLAIESFTSLGSSLALPFSII